MLDCKREIDELLERESIFWAQRAKENWLKGGDRNMSFFHAKATQKQKKKKIVRLMDEIGNWQDNAKDIEHIVVQYYQTLFTTGGEFANRGGARSCTA